tara:strand:+ start:431 stop:1336 length:906 start_codon:yes stop_codon:yes gene_type:complete
MKFIYKKEVRERLDKFLSKELPEISRSQIKKLIINKQVLVNNKESNVHHWLKKNDKVVYNIIKKEIAEKSNINPKIIFEDENYIIINKPSGILVHPTNKKETNTIANWLLKKFPNLIEIGDDPIRPGIVHRLDKEVSGLMIIALNQKYFNLLKKQFQDRTIKKAYTALIYGKLINNNGEIKTPLERDKKTGLMKAQTVQETGKEAYTVYEVIKKFINYTLVKVQIKTGRMHQIRAHFYSIGHAVVGDKLYITKDIRKKKKILSKKILLRADYLSFKDHNNILQEYKISLQKEFKEILKNLK